MADFYQNGVVPTLHQLRKEVSIRFDNDLRRFSGERKVGLVLPALYSEFKSEAIYQILEELRRATWVHRTVLVLSNATLEQYEEVRELFYGFRGQTTVLWRESDAMQDFLANVNGAGLAAAIPGKGRACWMGMNYLLAHDDVDIIAFQDCDIKTYRTRMLARLVYPLLDPELDYEFAKAYYPRFTGILNGRVTRLFLTPLVRTLEDAGVQSRFLRFLDGFRYCLSGEIAMKATLARQIRLAPDWGLEVSTLAEVYHRVPASRICQVDVAECYDHKHQHVSPDDPTRGLMRMCVDIAQSLLHAVCAEGCVISEGMLKATIPLCYERRAQEMIDRYEADARINELDYERDEEERNVEVFSEALKLACQQFTANPEGVPKLPNWRRVQSAVNSAAAALVQAGEPAGDWREVVATA